MTPHDWGNRALSRGDLVLDDRGLPWRITNFSYGRENVAVCDGMAYNHCQGQAVRLGETLFIERPPANSQHGREDFQLIFDALNIGDTLSEEVRKRRERFQETLGPNWKE